MSREDRTRGSRHRLLSVLVENKAGVLARVAGLFSRRGYNIFSLAVAPTDDERFSRISIVVDVESSPLEQVVAQLDKLINVVEIGELHPDEAREAELLLVSVSADAGQRSQVIQLVGVFAGRIVDVGNDAITVMVAGTPELLDDFESLMRPYGIAGLQRTGRIALPKLDGKSSTAGTAATAAGTA
jgi:acetolactate synthase-1/3 small subunit